MWIVPLGRVTCRPTPSVPGAGRPAGPQTASQVGTSMYALHASQGTSTLCRAHELYYLTAGHVYTVYCTELTVLPHRWARLQLHSSCTVLPHRWARVLSSCIVLPHRWARVQSSCTVLPHRSTCTALMFSSTASQMGSCTEIMFSCTVSQVVMCTEIMFSCTHMWARASCMCYVAERFNTDPDTTFICYSDADPKFT